jgi:hypothetical protein
MAFNKLYKHIEGLLQTDGEVSDRTPCKADILSVRECRSEGKVRKKNVNLGYDIVAYSDII